MGKRDSIIGNRYGRLEAVEAGEKNKHGKYSVRCKCDCGNFCVALEASLKIGHTSSCGCLKREVNSKVSRVDYTGVKNGRLLMLEDVGSRNGSRLWKCQCDCGNVVEVIGSSVKFGHTLSCGCLHKENTSAANTTHGMSYSTEYRTYASMLGRCYNENNEKYPIYGERGISVCDEWRESFETFFEDMGSKPKGLTLERMDVNRNYCKDNCIWDTPNEQAYNQRKRKDNTSGRVGVFLKHGLWLARIWKDRIAYDLGSYVAFEDAVAAREAGEMRLYGYLKDKE